MFSSISDFVTAKAVSEFAATATATAMAAVKGVNGRHK